MEEQPPKDKGDDDENAVRISVEQLPHSNDNDLLPHSQRLELLERFLADRPEVVRNFFAGKYTLHTLILFAGTSSLSVPAPVLNITFTLSMVSMSASGIQILRQVMPNIRSTLRTFLAAPEEEPAEQGVIYNWFHAQFVALRLSLEVLFRSLWVLEDRDIENNYHRAAELTDVFNRVEILDDDATSENTGERALIPVPHQPRVNPVNIDAYFARAARLYDLAQLHQFFLLNGGARIRPPLALQPQAEARVVVIDEDEDMHTSAPGKTNGK